MAFGLAMFAIEIIDLIADELDRTDILSLRYVCRELNRKTLHHFGHTCFRTVRTDLSRKSLQKLQELSEAESLRHHVHILFIKIASTVRERMYTDPEEQVLWPRHLSGYLEAPAPGTQQLRDILLEKLVNCRSFHIHGPDDVEQPYDSGHLLPSDAIGVILAVIAETSLPVKSFFVDYRRNQYSGGGRIDLKRLQLQPYQHPRFKSGWAYLQELYLDYYIDSDDSDWALNLILHAPNLQKLSLNFNQGADVPLIHRLTSEHRLPRLQSLRLACAQVTVEQISKLLTNSYDSLHVLALRFVTIGSGGSWGEIFRELRAKFSRLESISLGWLRKETADERSLVSFSTLHKNPLVPGSERTMPRSDCRLLQPWGLPITLTYKKWCGETRVFGVRYHGSQMDVVLKILIESAESHEIG